MDERVALSVVVASHARPLRLRWLLNALEDQTLSGDRWEVVVVHDYDPETAARVLDDHPLAAVGRLRHEAIDPGTGSPALQRNIGWRTARGDLIAFTDDDCRPSSEWLEALLETAAQHPGQLVQGATYPDPFEDAILAAPHVRTLYIEPPGPYAQTCNILYPRELLDGLGGFDEKAIAGEDVGLSLGAKAMGREIVPAAGAIVYHSIESHSLPGILRQNWKWRHLAYLAKRHPEVRATFPLRLFWDRNHLLTTAALGGAAVAGRTRWGLLLAAPLLVDVVRRRGPGRRRKAFAVVEAPGQVVRQAAEVGGLVAGSLRHRTLVL